jgi:hypothetical protein
MPNRDLEAPRQFQDDRGHLAPGVISRDMPGRGQATQGSPSLLEDKLFKPVPGARLNVPFSY